jgi:PIN domain nuclease of toxin-antitoxin system
LDTHALLWWLADDPELPPRASKLIRSRSNVIFVSAASAWEIGTKSRLGKLPQAADLALRFDAILAQESFESLPITSAHAARAGFLPGPHKDPFDRMLIAQSQAENLPIVSNDAVFDTYKLRRLWA